MRDYSYSSTTIDFLVYFRKSGRKSFILDGGGKASTNHYASDSGEKDFLTAKSHAGNTINLFSQGVSLD